MHELPKDLTTSLRSWRGSVHESNYARQPIDLEKGPGEGSDKTSEGSLDENARARTWPRAQSQSQQQQHGQYDQISQHKDSHHAISGQHAAPSSDAPQRNASKKQTRFSQLSDAENDDARPLSKDDFYELIGMRPPVHKSEIPRDVGVRGGLYARIDGQMHYTQTKYRIFDVATYVFLCLQVLLSAVFIVLGSLTKVDSHVAIAIIGAISTVIASLLAMMKGQGLPNRLRQTRDALRDVLFEAQELYWDVGADRQVTYQEIKKIRERFTGVMEEARKNHPDTWNSSTNKYVGGGSGQGKSNAPATSPAPAAPASTK